MEEQPPQPVNDEAYLKAAKNHPANKCAFYIARKRRMCKFDVCPGKRYCGNHLYLFADGEGEGEGKVVQRGEVTAGQQGSVDLNITGEQQQQQQQQRCDLLKEGRSKKKKKSEEERVPCPADPRHFIAKNLLEVHLKKCPAALQAASVQAAPHYELDINAGSEDDALRALKPNQTANHPQQPPLTAALAAITAGPVTASTAAAVAASGLGRHAAMLRAQGYVGDVTEGLSGLLFGGPFAPGRAAARAAAARAMGREGFMAFTQRLRDAYAQVCGGQPPPMKEVLPDVLRPQVEAMQGSAMGRKHGRQTASILGHLMDVGVLPLTNTNAQPTSNHSTNPTTEPNAIESDAQQIPDTSGELVSVDGLSSSVAVKTVTGGGWVVELGAGKGTLTGMAAVAPVQSTGMMGAVMVDCRAAFKSKADRYMRHVQVQRIKMDLKDLALDRLSALQTRQLTDNGRNQNNRKAVTQPRKRRGRHARTSDAPTNPQNGDEPVGDADDGGGDASGDVTIGFGGAAASASPAVGSDVAGAVPGAGGGGGGGGSDDACPSPPWVVLAKHLCGAATDYALRAVMRGVEKQPVKHAHKQHTEHEQQQHTGYEQQQQEQQQTHENQDASMQGSPGAALPLADVQGGVHVQGDGCAASSLRGLAIATCCHHRCGWKSYVGKGLFRRLGFNPTEFEIISWMTGWALCGHDTPAGVAAQRQKGAMGPEGETGRETDGVGCDDEEEGEDQEDADDEMEDVQDEEGGESGPRGEVEGGEEGGAGSSAKRARMSKDEPHGGLVVGGWDPVRGPMHTRIPRAERMELGAMAKLLIDRGRLMWLSEQLGLLPPGDAGVVGVECEKSEGVGVKGGDLAYWSAGAVKGCCGGCGGCGRCVYLMRYMDEMVSGENKVLVARV